jgi:hypothetical protein
MKIIQSYDVFDKDCPWITNDIKGLKMVAELMAA